MPAQYKRFLSDQPQNYDQFIESARNYVENARTDPRIERFHYAKPFDRDPGHPEYFRLMYFALNMLQAMNLPPVARVLEVGSGGGWLTEILVALGMRVEAVEPSEDFNQIARERVDGALQNYHLTQVQPAPSFQFHTTTLEACDFPDESFDGIIFFATLHHIVDEDAGLQKCFRWLKAGGCVGISCEEAWLPERSGQMTLYEQETATYGTLENPFTREYLDELLTEVGFTPILRFHQINGWFPTATENQTLIQLAQIPAEFSNDLIAYKPLGDHPTTDDPNVLTSAAITILSARLEADGSRLHVDLRLTNSGETAWLHQLKAAGWVSVGLFQGGMGQENFLESAYRAPLPRTILPGASCDLSLNYPLPEGYRAEDWQIDLINEGYFWFSSRGSQPAVIPARDR